MTDAPYAFDIAPPNCPEIPYLARRHFVPSRGALREGGRLHWRVQIADEGRCTIVSGDGSQLLSSV